MSDIEEIDLKEILWQNYTILAAEIAYVEYAQEINAQITQAQYANGIVRDASVVQGRYSLKKNAQGANLCRILNDLKDRTNDALSYGRLVKWDD